MEETVAPSTATPQTASATEEKSVAVTLPVGVTIEGTVAPSTATPQAATEVEETSAAVTLPVGINIERTVAPSTATLHAAIVTKETSAAVTLPVRTKIEGTIVPSVATPQASPVTKDTSAAFTLPVHTTIGGNIALLTATLSAASSSRKRKAEDCHGEEMQGEISLSSTNAMSTGSCARNQSTNYHMEGNQDRASLTAKRAERIQQPEVITIMLKGVGKDPITYFRVNEVVSMRNVFKIYAKRKGVCARDLRFFHEGQRIFSDETPRSSKLKDGDQIDVCASMTGGKPVILLYPLTQHDATVHLELSAEWSFSALYPKPLLKGLPRSDMLRTSQVQCGEKWNGGDKCVWKVKASPDGSLLNLETGKKYPYLFWEAQSKDERVTQKFKLEKAPSFCVAGVKAGELLDDALTRLGLNMRERCDMITFWLPQLEAYPFNVIYFVDVQRYEQAAKLEISPAPDVIIRVFMVFRGVKNYENHGDLGKLNCLQAPAREGFVAVEWGGMNLNGSVHL